jgi:hypothetical protein
MARGLYFNGSRAVMLDPPGLDDRWGTTDPVLHDEPRRVLPPDETDPDPAVPRLLWVAGGLDLTAYRYRQAPEPVVLADGEVVCEEFDPDELSSVHLLTWSGDVSAARRIGPAATTTAATGVAPATVSTCRCGGAGARTGERSEPDLAGTAAAATVPPRRLDRLAVARWRKQLVDLPAGPDLAAHLAARPPAPERLDLTPTAGGTEQQAWAQALLDSVAARQRLIDHLQARQAADLHDLERGYPGLVEFLPTELGFALHLTDNAAEKLIDTARRIRLRLPSTWAAWDTGTVSTDKAHYLANATKNLDRHHTHRVERDVLPEASSQTLPEFRAAVRRAIIRTDPEGADARHQAAVGERRIEKYARDDGMGELRVHASATDIQHIWEALTGLAHAAKTPDDQRTTDQRRTDVLVDLCADILDRGGWNNEHLPTRQRSKVLINVTMPITALAGDRGDVCELEGYGPITTGQAWTLTTDAELRRMVCDPLTGTLIDASTPGYRPPKWLTELILARDRVCSCPGCNRPAMSTQLDHRTPYRQGGGTSGSNLHAVCLHHHRIKDGGGFHLRRQPNGDDHWTTPLARTATKRAARWWQPVNPITAARNRQELAADHHPPPDIPPPELDPNYIDEDDIGPYSGHPTAQPPPERSLAVADDPAPF